MKALSGPPVAEWCDFEIAKKGHKCPPRCFYFWQQMCHWISYQEVTVNTRSDVVKCNLEDICGVATVTWSDLKSFVGLFDSDYLTKSFLLTRLDKIVSCIQRR